MASHAVVGKHVPQQVQAGRAPAPQDLKRALQRHQINNLQETRRNLCSLGQRDTGWMASKNGVQSKILKPLSVAGRCCGQQVNPCWPVSSCYTCICSIFVGKGSVAA